MSILKTGIQGGAAKGDDTIETVVLAASGLNSAKSMVNLRRMWSYCDLPVGTGSGSEKDTDRVASDADGDVSILPSDSQGADEGLCWAGGGGLDVIAALKGTEANISSVILPLALHTKTHPTLHWLTGPLPPWPWPVAAAVTKATRVETMRVMKNIVDVLKECGVASELRIPEGFRPPFICVFLFQTFCLCKL
jgi:hypothetical protein